MARGKTRHMLHGERGAAIMPGQNEGNADKPAIHDGSPFFPNALKSDVTFVKICTLTPFSLTPFFPDGLVPAGSLQWLSVARFRFLLSVCCCLLASAFPASQAFGWRQMIVDLRCELENERAHKASTHQKSKINIHQSSMNSDLKT
jgi:hypothetical protein